MVFCYVGMREKEDRTGEQNKNNYKAYKKAIRAKKKKKEKIVKNWQKLLYGVRRHLRICLQKVFNRKRLGKSAFQSNQLANIEYIAIITSHIVENPDSWNFRLCKEKRTTSTIFSSSASKWKSLFWTAFLLEGMGKGEKNSPLVLKIFVVETVFFLFKKNPCWPFFSAQVPEITFQIQYINDFYELMLLPPNKHENFNYMS